jgi:Tol biopolymer transport system component
MRRIFFTRQEARGVSLWSYDVQNNYLSNYSYGMNPCVIGDETILCARINGFGRGEIWEVNLATGVEECIVSDLNGSFSTPVLSPNGHWIAFVGSAPLINENTAYWNTDIYICRRDGTDRHQLTYHAADDLSPVWSKDGRYIFFISQRGSVDAIANIWRLTVPE